MAYRKGEPANRSKSVKKRQYASRTPQARSYSKPKKVVEQGVGMGNVLRGVARIVSVGGKARAAAGRPKPNPGSRAAKKSAATTRTPGRRTAKTPQWATSYGSKKPSQVTIKVNRRDIAQTKRVQEYVASKPKAKPKMSKKKKAAIGAGVVTGVGALGYATKPKSMGSEGPKGKSSSSMVGGKKRKNVVHQSSAIRFRG